VYCRALECDVKDMYIGVDCDRVLGNVGDDGHRVVKRSGRTFPNPPEPRSLITSSSENCSSCMSRLRSESMLLSIAVWLLVKQLHVILVVEYTE